MPINVFKSAKIQIFEDTSKNAWSVSQLQATITFICFYSLGSLEKRRSETEYDYTTVHSLFNSKLTQSL